MSEFRIDPYNYLSYISLTKYDNLTGMVNEYYKGSDSDYIDLYIDLSCFINILISKKDY